MPRLRLLSAFRDKLERCAAAWDCTKRKDWSDLVAGGAERILEMLYFSLGSTLNKGLK